MLFRSRFVGNKIEGDDSVAVPSLARRWIGTGRRKAGRDFVYDMDTHANEWMQVCQADGMAATVEVAEWKYESYTDGYTDAPDGLGLANVTAADILWGREGQCSMHRKTHAMDL